ncbi:putative BRCT domain-containing protein [Plasmopara halstedii]
MAAQWETAQKRLRVYLREDDDYICFLESVVTGLARKLRFNRRSRGGSIVDSLALDRFIETAAQLRHHHLFFQVKLKAFTEPTMKGGRFSVARKLSSLVEIIADMFRILRVHYVQLFCRSEATQKELNSLLEINPKDWDGDILEKYLMEQQIRLEKLVDRPLKRFNELIEVIEALCSIFEEEKRIGPDDDVTAKEVITYVSELLNIVEESKHCIQIAKADSREEEELIALQASFYGDGAEFFYDLSANKVLLQGEAFLSLDISCQLSPKTMSRTNSLTQPSVVYIHCFQDGTFVCSRQNLLDMKSGSSFMILHRLQLKQDAIFLEQTPASVPGLESSDKSRSLALILQDTILLFFWPDSIETQRWHETIRGLLEMNEFRIDKLRKDRAFCDLPVPENIKSYLGETKKTPTEFASFFDDYFPGIFWMTCGKDSDSSKPWWNLVEVVFYARWLIIYKINGWRRHSILCQFDTHKPMLEISEQPRGDKEWSLNISDGSSSSISLVTKMRTRIDFWFDQVSKAVESARLAALRAKKEERQSQEIGNVNTHVVDDSSKNGVCTGTKRRLKVVHDQVNNHLGENSDSFCKLNPAISGFKKSNDLVDSMYSGHDSVTSTIIEKEEPERPLAKKSRRSSVKLQLPHSSITLPTVKSSKRRLVKKRMQNPNENAVVPAQLYIMQHAASNAAAEETNIKKVRIILTGVEPTETMKKKITSIAGASYENDIYKATHIIAPKNQLKRTVKLLCGISRCTHVLDARWIDESARAGGPVFERVHCLKDTKAEAKWHFDLRKTMYDFTPEQRQQLFAGQEVFITNHKSVLPPVADLVKIVECAGAVAVTKGCANSRQLIITNETALSSAAVRKTLAQADPQRIYSVELILSSILQQRIDFNKNRLEPTLLFKVA